jgi:hypothetical protein
MSTSCAAAYGLRRAAARMKGRSIFKPPATIQNSTQASGEAYAAEKVF